MTAISDYAILRLGGEQKSRHKPGLLTGMGGGCPEAAPFSAAAARSSAGLSDSVRSGREGPVL